jgi:sugar phosphate isomerase/epimerase
MPPISRRAFLQLAAVAAAAPIPRAFSIEPFRRPGAARMRLSLAAYSFRDYFNAKRPLAEGERHIDLKQFIDYCVEHGCDGAELTSYYFPAEPTADFLRDIRRHAFLRGVEISGTAVGNSFTAPKGAERDREIALVKKWVDHAALLGAPHIRVFAGGAAKGQSTEEARRLCIEALEECGEYAGQRGIFLGIENHGGIVAEPGGLLEIVKDVKSRWIGISLDTGNFHTEDPYVAVNQCAPYAVNVQLKAEIRPAGAKANSPADLPRLVRILRDASYQGWVALEYESKETPWKAVPPLLTELRKMLSTPAAEHGTPGTALFDGKTLNGWKITDFAGHGEVTVEKGTIVLDVGNDLTGVNYADALPKMNYEVELEAMKVIGDDFFCGLTFPVADAHATLIVGGWGGGVVGISSLDGNDASENETTQAMRFEKGRWYRIRLRVLPDRLQTWIDNEQVIDVETEGKRINLRAGEIEQSVPFGIASFRTRAALRNILLRRI